MAVIDRNLTDTFSVDEIYTHNNFQAGDLEDVVPFSENYTHTVWRSSSLSDEFFVNDNFDVRWSRTFHLSDSFQINEAYAPGFFDNRVVGPINNPPSMRPVVVVPPTPLLGSPVVYEPVVPGVTLSGSGSVVLPAPEFGDTDSFSAQRILTRLKDSEHVNVFRELYWSQTRIFTLTWAHLTEQQANDVQSFLVENVGTQITLQDYWNRSWSVIVLTPDAPITQDERVGWNITLVFQQVDN